MLLVLAVGRLGLPNCARQVRFGSECRASGVDPAGQARRHLPGQPRIPVGVVEREERPLAGALEVGAGLARLGRERRAVPHVTRFNSAADELAMRRFDVGHDQAAQA